MIASKICRTSTALVKQSIQVQAWSENYSHFKRSSVHPFKLLFSAFLLPWHHHQQDHLQKDHLQKDHLHQPTFETPPLRIIGYRDQRPITTVHQ